MTFTRQTTPKAFPSITELARALRAGETSSVALTQDCLQRIARFDTHFHSFMAVYADEAWPPPRRPTRTSRPAAGAARCTAFRWR